MKKAQEEWKHDAVYDPKRSQSLEFSDLLYDPKGHGVTRDRRHLLYHPKGHSDLCGRFDLVYDPFRSKGH